MTTIEFLRTTTLPEGTFIRTCQVIGGYAAVSDGAIDLARTNILASAAPQTDILTRLRLCEPSVYS
jgi:hypothetical protein